MISCLLNNPSIDVIQPAWKKVFYSVQGQQNDIAVFLNMAQIIWCNTVLVWAWAYLSILIFWLKWTNNCFIWCICACHSKQISNQYPWKLAGGGINRRLIRFILEKDLRCWVYKIRDIGLREGTFSKFLHPDMFKYHNQVNIIYKQFWSFFAVFFC